MSSQPRSGGRRLVAAAVLTALWFVATAMTAGDVALAGVRSDGPVVAVGFSEKLRNDMVLPSFGWRWRFEPGATLQRWGTSLGTDLTFVVEPLVAGIVGDKDSFEVQAVPLARVEPSSRRDAAWSPYMEAGVGLIYTALEDLRLGSNLLFSDNLGIGFSLALPSQRWSRLGIGYRFRHISHAGLLGSPNSGMNTHYVTLTLE